MSAPTRLRTAVAGAGSGRAVSRATRRPAGADDPQSPPVHPRGLRERRGGRLVSAERGGEAISRRIRALDAARVAGPELQELSIGVARYRAQLLRGFTEIRAPVL